MSVIDYTIKNLILGTWINVEHTDPSDKIITASRWTFFDGLQPLRRWLNAQEISDRNLAHRVCRFIPAQCPFARDIKVFGRVLVSIPPLCKINPLYDELMSLRFRALCYLAEKEEDISQYC
ncbi:Mo-dependent nitrogenase C-terminal domain-containing protein [Aphanothece sacrum]|uniref:Nitrogenase n=1 Tax=Aphanothece sacrum FPU1 TaxID=1920663 RepID=A0A401IKI5_APHSA|nr:Mo-dependent nitrogenase C-terminal domain-containing protein [Aphanothece sacrum]GBF81734.1 nitrogenase [Aphanothece sacrum FPU1]GBF85092.1 nitrogenase [Aphanothece sacrum FPU3]